MDLYSPFNQANPLFKGSPLSQGFFIILFIIATDGWKVICVCRRESWAARLRCIVPDILYGNGSRYAENDLVLRHGKGVSGKTLSVLVFHYVAPEKSCGSSLFHCFRPKAFQHSCAIKQCAIHFAWGWDCTTIFYVQYEGKHDQVIEKPPPLFALQCVGVELNGPQTISISCCSPLRNRFFHVFFQSPMSPRFLPLQSLNLGRKVQECVGW